MTPKEKAKELLIKLYQPIFDIDCGYDILKDGGSDEAARQCALIAVDEILQNVYDDRATIGRGNLTDKEYWTEVKQEIEKL